MTKNGDKPWRMRVQLPQGYEGDSRELFEWLRHWLLPAILHAPIRITLHLVPPDDDDVHPFDETE